MSRGSADYNDGIQTTVVSLKRLFCVWCLDGMLSRACWSLNTLGSIFVFQCFMGLVLPVWWFRTTQELRIVEVSLARWNFHIKLYYGCLHYNLSPVEYPESFSLSREALAYYNLIDLTLAYSGISTPAYILSIALVPCPRVWNTCRDFLYMFFDD
jgi:hypothetical protein